jgi:hypothetical protein
VLRSATVGEGRAGIPLLLQRVPDARRAPLHLFPPVLLPYVALMLGVAVAGLVALYNSLALRRARAAIVAAAIGVAGWLGFGFLFAMLVAAGLHNVLLALLPVRLLNVGLGAVLAWSQWSHVRGHTFLGGRTVVLLPAVLAAFVLVLVMPVRLRLVLEGLWLVLLR